MAPPTTTIVAIARGRAPANALHMNRPRYILYYDVVTTPNKPLRVGARVKISEVEEIDNPFDDGYDAPRTFRAKETGIEGMVTGVRSMERDVVEFVVTNENIQSPTAYAYLTIEHSQGETTYLEVWRRLLRWILLPILPTTRRVPIEDEALVLDGRMMPRTGPEAREYGEEAEGANGHEYGL